MADHQAADPTNVQPSRLRIALTGASGTIGRILSEHFEPLHDLLLLDRLPGRNVRVVNLSDPISGLFENVDVVIHLAANPSAFADWESVKTDNIDGTFNVLEEARRTNVKRIIFASTNHVQHGDTISTTPETLNPQLHPVSMTTSDPVNPDSLYAVSKLFGENLGKLYSERYGLEFLALRIGWITSDDQPQKMKGTSAEDYMRSMYLSHRDCVNYFQHALDIRMERKFWVGYAVSNNRRKVFNLEDTARYLGYEAVDDVEDRWKE